MRPAVVPLLLVTALLLCGWTVGDGDSLRDGEKRVRLHGIDAPELQQSCERDGACYPCGQRSKAGLEALVNGRDLAFKQIDVDRYGRTIAIVFADGEDVALAQIEAGHAIAYRYFLPEGKLRERYIAAEERARASHRGIWASRFDEPYRWRKRERTVCE